MKLSVIVPVYKAEKTLCRCVDSLLAQTLSEPFELILVNDGSPDRCGEILADYALRYPGRIRVLTLTNGGQGRARNHGLELAQGEYIGFCDSDDWVEPAMYVRLCAVADETGADIVDCCVLAEYEDGRKEQPRTWREENVLSAAGSVCNKLFRRRAMADLRFPEKLWYEDFEYSAIALMRAKKIIHIPDLLYHYRVGQPSTMNNQNARKNLDVLTVLEHVRSAMAEDQLRDGYDSLVLNHVLLDAINRLSLQHNPDKLEAIAKLRAFVRQEIPDLSGCSAFRAEPRNRRIIMRLNYLGLEDLSRLILKLKSAI